MMNDNALKAFRNQLDTNPVEKLAIEGEKNAYTLKIIVPLEGDGVDYTTLEYTMKGVIQDIQCISLLGKNVGNKFITLTWEITADWTTITGYMNLVLIGSTTTGNVVKKWEATKPVYISADIDGTNAPTADIAEQIFLQVQAFVAQAADSAASAVASEIIAEQFATAAAQSASSASDSATAAQSSETNAAESATAAAASASNAATSETNAADSATAAALSAAAALASETAAASSASDAADSADSAADSAATALQAAQEAANMPNVKYTSQSPTAAQQQQAQSNIGHVLYKGTTEYAVRFAVSNGFPAVTLTQLTA